MKRLPPVGLGLALVALWRQQFFARDYHASSMRCKVCVGRVTRKAQRWLESVR